jgi:hypothetical protein
VDQGGIRGALSPLRDVVLIRMRTETKGLVGVGSIRARARPDDNALVVPEFSPARAAGSRTIGTDRLVAIANDAAAVSSNLPGLGAPCLLGSVGLPGDDSGAGARPLARSGQEEVVSTGYALQWRERARLRKLVRSSLRQPLGSPATHGTWVVCWWLSENLKVLVKHPNTELTRRCRARARPPRAGEGPSSLWHGDGKTMRKTRLSARHPREEFRWDCVAASHSPPPLFWLS